MLRSFELTIVKKMEADDGWGGGGMSGLGSMDRSRGKVFATSMFLGRWTHEYRGRWEPFGGLLMNQGPVSVGKVVSDGKSQEDCSKCNAVCSLGWQQGCMSSQGARWRSHRFGISIQGRAAARDCLHIP